MKQWILGLLLLANAVQATPNSRISLNGISVGLGLGGAHNIVEATSRFDYINLNSHTLIPDGYQQRGNYRIGEVYASRPTVSAFLGYEHWFDNPCLHRHSIGFMTSYDTTGHSEIGSPTISGITFSDPTYNYVYDRYEKPSSVTVTASLSTHNHWSIGPSLGYAWTDQATVFTRISYHHLSGNTVQSVSTPDTHYSPVATVYSTVAFHGIGLAMGGNFGPKKGWFFQPEIEYVWYQESSAPANTLTDIIGYEATVTQDYDYKPSSYAGRLVFGYRF